MGKIIVTLLMMAGIALASGGSGEGGTDIVQRTVNFIIFAGIIYYLLAEPIKGYFVGRSADIASELEKVQDKLRESKEAKEAVQAEIEEAQKFAVELQETAKKENIILNDKIVAQCESDLENMGKHHVALMELEQRKMVRNSVDEIMSEILNEDSSGFDKDTMAKIIMKKVA
ncbi:MAG: F0F1 ATP synthase subunit B [Campylobacterota bacterium]|nr:F0F1 ATP synthase subunit B [Campylobacterota bacterium]